MKRFSNVKSKVAEFRTTTSEIKKKAETKPLTEKNVNLHQEAEDVAWELDDEQNIAEVVHDKDEGLDEEPEMCLEAYGGPRIVVHDAGNKENEKVVAEARHVKESPCKSTMTTGSKNFMRLNAKDAIERSKLLREKNIAEMKN